MRTFIFALTAVLAAATTATADDRVMEIVSLKHRLVGDILPTLRQLVAAGGTVTGLNDQVIIRTTAANLAELKGVLAAIDTRLRQLRITVRQDIEAATQRRQDELSARISAGDVSAGVGRPRGGPGARISIGDGDNRVDYHNLSTRGHEDNEHAHFVSTLEGQAAFINTGQSVPVADRAIVQHGYGATVYDSVNYRDVGTGFYVTPRIIGQDGVNLEISPYAERLNKHGGGVIDSRGLSTMVNGRLGEWIALGGAGGSFNDSAAGTAYHSRQSGREIYDVWVKVEVVP